MATNFLTKLFGSRNDRLLKQYRKTVARINAMEPEYEKLSDEERKRQLISLSQELTYEDLDYLSKELHELFHGDD